MLENLWRMQEILNLGNLGFNYCFWKSYHHILMHCDSYNSLLWVVSKTFSKTVFFSKILWVSVCFDWSSLFFDRSKLFLKISMSLCVFWSIETVFQSIENRMGCFFKTEFQIRQTLFQKVLCFFSFHTTRFFVVFALFFLQGFPFPRLVRPLYPSFCIYFHVFMHKLMHFCEIFETFQNWDFCWINPLFVKLIIGFCSCIVIFMIYVG